MYHAHGRDLSMPENCNVRAVAVTETRKLPLMEQFFAVRRFSSVLAFTADGIAAPVREQHVRAVQPLARSGRGRLAGPADLVHRRDGARRGRLADGRPDRALRRPRRRRVPSALHARLRPRLAGEADRRAAGPALRRRRRVGAGRDEVRVRRERAQPVRHGGLGSRRRRAARRGRSSARACSPSRGASLRTGRSC